MSSHEVHWHEGMFLRPHHFQALQRHTSLAMTRGQKWDLEHGWGLRFLRFSADKLDNYRFEVIELKARMEDGTLISIPEDGTVEPADLQDKFKGSDSISVYLAVPIPDRAQTNVGPKRRYAVREILEPDENEPENQQLVGTRGLNFRLLLSTDDYQGYERLEIARIRRNFKQGSPRPELDTSYIPPLLACDAWEPLQLGFLEHYFERIAKLLDDKATEAIRERKLTFENQQATEQRIFEQLRSLNEAYAVLWALKSTRGLPPYQLYLESVRLIGQLVIFCENYNRRTPKQLPPYEHKNLGECFGKLRQQLDTILKEFEDLRSFKRAFVGKQLRMEVKLEPEWLQTNWRFYICVKSLWTTEQCTRMLRPGGLDMKVGSVGNVDEIFRSGSPGLRFKFVGSPPPILPQTPGLVYFEIDRNDTGPNAAFLAKEWASVRESYSLAVRLNENLIAGKIEGQEMLWLKASVMEGTKFPQTSFSLTLVVLPVPPEGMGSGFYRSEAAMQP